MQKLTKFICTCIAGLGLFGLFLSTSAQALEFRSVSANKAILFDAPSIEAQKLYILSANYPVEVIVNLGEWIKVRDHYGSLSWIQGKQLAPKRTVIVLEGPSDIRQSENETSALLATVEKDVVLELLTPVAKNGWVKVKHRDGITGYMQVTALWGI